MEKKYQFFISSTYEDLKVEREKAISTIPAGNPDAGVSYTEKEFNYAVSKHIPVLALRRGDRPGWVRTTEFDIEESHAKILHLAGCGCCFPRMSMKAGTRTMVKTRFSPSTN